jgi:hypothetical protein
MQRIFDRPYQPRRKEFDMIELLGMYAAGAATGAIAYAMIGARDANKLVTENGDMKRQAALAEARATSNRQACDRASDAAAVLQAKLDAIADATRAGQNGTARMVFRMTGR